MLDLGVLEIDVMRPGIWLLLVRIQTASLGNWSRTWFGGICHSRTSADL